MQMKLKEGINVALGGIDQLSTTYLAFGKYLKRSGNTIRTCQLFIDFEKAYDYNILIKFGVPKK